MTGNSDMTNHDTPADLRLTEAALEALARAEQNAAPATLEARVFMATRGLLPVAAPADAPAVVVRRTSFLSRVRIAASVAIVGGLGALWLAQGVGPADKSDLASLEADVDFVLAMKADGMSTTRESIDALYLDADNLGDSLKRHDGAIIDEGSM
jgi:hypothetical protein